MKKYLLLLLLSAAATFTSCDSDDDKTVTPTQNPGTTPTDTIPKIQHVTAKTWRITAFTQGSPGSATQSDVFTSGFPNCQKDDIYKFTAPAELTINTGNNKCSSSETDKTGTWDLNNTSTTFTINNPSQTIIGLNGTFSVIEITASRMIISQVVNGSEYTLTFSAN